MSFPVSVTEQVLLKCGRHCCICHKFCGTKIELHHIVQKADEGQDTEDNRIPLCFDCHADVGSYNEKHPKGRKYSANELKLHRDKWYEKVQRTGGLAANPDYITVDRQIFEQIQEVLPSTIMMPFLAELDFGDVFSRTETDPLHKFVQLSKLPEFEFLDSDLEGLRVQLSEHIRTLSYMLALETQPIGKDDFRLLSPYHHDNGLQIRESETTEEYEGRVAEYKQHYNRIRNELNELASATWEIYTQLIRTGRRKLAG